MKTLATLSLVVLLSACGTQQVKIEPTIPMDTPKQSVNIDTELLQLCDEHLASPALKSYTEKDSLDIIAGWDMQNFTCALRHNKLVAIVKKAFNLDANSQPVNNQR